MLHSSFSQDLYEAGVDEAGRGAAVGPVVAAAVVLPKGFESALLRDSKKLTEKQRLTLREEIEREALAWAIGEASHQEIDQYNILQATFLAMHRAIAQLAPVPELLLIDGNRFKPYPFVAHQCVIGGDDLYYAIAAASILAKTHRDALLKELDAQYPQYGWAANKGYLTKAHREAIAHYGACPVHRQSFKLLA
ncbi:ribonuclease HII [Eisenibacter elegans]|uniref:ribonuclease HII n=1 Tax=Eisenibacter elegans TaxID=997 RepID=UPI00040C72BF|nr:ribonuclease HII [Eisenibacter elegans]